MPRNNDGSVILPISFTQEDIQNKSFTGEKLDLPLKDLAEIATNSLDVFGRNTMQADLRMGDNRITGVKDGVALSDVATVRQASGGGIFAEDISTDSSKIELIQKPLQTIKEYKNGMQITFIVKNNSVNNMQVRLNELEYKELDYNQIGKGSYVCGGMKTIMYLDNKFIPVDEVNRYKRPTVIGDFNDYIFPTRIWCDIRNALNKPPSNLHGILEYMSGGNKFFGTQIFYGEDGYIYTRYYHLNNIWGKWNRLATTEEVNEVNKKLNDVVILGRTLTTNRKYPLTKNDGRGFP